MPRRVQLVIADGRFPASLLDRDLLVPVPHAEDERLLASPPCTPSDLPSPETKEEQDEVQVVAIVASNQGLRGLPAELPYLASLARHLRKLDLSFNQLAHMPDAFARLIHLEHVNLSHNCFEKVPDALMNLTPSLRHLSMSDNQLSTLPDGFGRLSKLESLFLNQNRFGSVPSAVYDLPSLLSLSLGRNNISTLISDDATQGFARMTQLMTLDLASNAFRNVSIVLPASLTSLDLSSNTTLTSLSISRSSAAQPKLKRLDLSKCALSVLPTDLAYFDRLKELRLAGNPWDEDHAFLRTNPLPLAAQVWLQLRNPDRSDPKGRFSIPAETLVPGEVVESHSSYVLRSCKLLPDEIECSLKSYAENTSLEAIAHDISILERMYGKEDQSPIIGLCYGASNASPSLVLRSCAGTLHKRLREELSLQERAQLAFQAAEALDALITSAVDEDSSSEASLEMGLLGALLYHDIQHSERWMFLEDGRLVLCGSSLPDQSSTVLSPEMRKQERKRQLQEERRQKLQLRQDPLAMLEAIAAEMDDNEYGHTREDELTWRWGLVPIKPSDSTSQLVFSLGVLLHEIFTGEPIVRSDRSNPERQAEPSLRSRMKKPPIELPLAIRQLLRWTWEWERETEKEAKRRRERERRQPSGESEARERWQRGERRPTLKDVIWICFWLGHDRTRLSSSDTTRHELSLSEFGPEFISATSTSSADGEEEELDDETRQSLINLFEATQQNVARKAATTRAFRREQKREQYWTLSRGADMMSDSSDDDEDDEDDAAGESPVGNAGLMHLQSLLANITNSAQAFAGSKQQ